MLSRRLQKSLSWLADNTPPQLITPETPYIAMDSAENWLIRPALLPLMRDGLAQGLQAEHLSYSKSPGGPEDLLRGTAAFMNRFFAPRTKVLPEHVATGAGASALLDSLDFALCEADEGLLIDAPMWEGFGIATNLRNDDRLVPVARPHPDAGPEHVFQHYLKAMEAAPCRIRGIIVCNPQNPYGHIYPTSWLEAVLRFCQVQDIHYISDEIYALSTWVPSEHPTSAESGSRIFKSPETTFTSVLSLDLKRLRVDPARVHVIYALSKDLGSSGLRLVCSPCRGFLTRRQRAAADIMTQGFFVTQNAELRHAMWMLNRYRVSSASAVVGACLFSDLSALGAILAQNALALRQSADMVGSFLSFHNVDFYQPLAGVFVWARLGGRSATPSSDLDLLRRFAAERVAVATGGAFHESEPGWFRITHAIPQELLLEGLRRIEGALCSRQKWHLGGDQNRALSTTRKGTQGGTSLCALM